MRHFTHHFMPVTTSPRTTAGNFRAPRFESHQRNRTLELDVFVPGVAPDGVDLAVADGELIVTARKPHAVRRNWQAAHFEAVQHDYQLRVPLGAAFDPHHVRAVLRDGILKIQLRRRASATAALAPLPAIFAA